MPTLVLTGPVPPIAIRWRTPCTWRTRRGVGKALLRTLIQACREQGFRQMIAIIGDSANHASVQLHETVGFDMIGTIKDVGYKHDRWLDSVLMQLPLGDGASTPPD